MEVVVMVVVVLLVLLDLSSCVNNKKTVRWMSENHRLNKHPWR